MNKFRPYWLFIGVAVFVLGGLSVPLVMGMTGSTNEGSTLAVFVPPAETVTGTVTSTLTVTATATYTGTGTTTPTVTATSVVTGTPTMTGTVEPKVTICHRTGSQHNPYVEITVSQSALPAHQAHGDVIPAPPGGCSALVTTPTVTGTPMMTGTPTVTGTPMATGTALAKVTICHRTGSQTHPYSMITVSVDAVPAHTAHGDLIPAPANGCPAGVAPNTKHTTSPPGKSKAPSNPGNGQNKNPNVSPGNGNGNGNNGNTRDKPNHNSKKL